MLDSLWCHVACRVRQLIFDPTLIGPNYRNFTKLAVAFTTEALKDPATAKKYKHSAVSLFQHFTSINVKDPRYSFIHYRIKVIRKIFDIRIYNL